MTLSLNSCFFAAQVFTLLTLLLPAADFLVAKTRMGSWLPGTRWLHESVGANWRMLEMQAAIGPIQLRQMPAWTAAPRRFSGGAGPDLDPVCGPARRGAFAAIPLRSQLPGAATCKAGCVHAQYKAYAYVRPENLAHGWSRHRIGQEINALGPPVYQGSCSEV